MGQSWDELRAFFGNDAWNLPGYWNPNKEGEAVYEAMVRQATDDWREISSTKSDTPADDSTTCLAANIAAVNQVSNLNVSSSNVVGAPYKFNGGWNVNFSVSGASPSQLPPGRYALSTLGQISGIGHALHVPGSGGADPSTYGTDATTGNFTFTTHIDSAFSTWRTPLGALIHYLVDVRDKGAHRKGC